MCRKKWKEYSIWRSKENVRVDYLQVYKSCVLIHKSSFSMYIHLNRRVKQCIGELIKISVIYALCCVHQITNALNIVKHITEITLSKDISKE